ncbi:MAG: hypothetical protein M3290_04540 [Actinomycetota bacterium]|nr:hypothetical protein [Actinomycetota bacterium]
MNGLMKAMVLPVPPLGDEDADALDDDELDEDAESVAVTRLGFPKELTGSNTASRNIAPSSARTTRASARPSDLDMDDRFKLYLLASRLTRGVIKPLPIQRTKARASYPLSHGTL